MSQFKYFRQDVKRIIGKEKYRILYVWMNRNFWGVFLYRFERGLYLGLGKLYSILRILFLPILNLIQSYSNMDIHYKADIQGGLVVLHPSIGCVISRYCIIGKNLTLTGGNVLGVKKRCKVGSFKIGDDCTFGANATLVGPVILGDKIVIGSSACVVDSYLIERTILAGVPAKAIDTSKY